MLGRFTTDALSILQVVCSLTSTPAVQYLNRLSRLLRFFRTLISKLRLCYQPGSLENNKTPWTGRRIIYLELTSTSHLFTIRGKWRRLLWHKKCSTPLKLLYMHPLNAVGRGIVSIFSFSLQLSSYCWLNSVTSKIFLRNSFSSFVLNY